MLLSDQMTALAHAMALFTPAMIATHTRQLELAGIVACDLSAGLRRAAEMVRELEANAGLVAPVEDMADAAARARRAGLTIIQGGRS